VVAVPERGIVNDKDPCSCQVRVAREIDLECLALAWQMAVDQAERFLGQIVAAGRMADARDEVDLGDTVAEVDVVAVAAAVLLNSAGCQDNHWEVDDCTGFEDPWGIAVQGRGHCADHNVAEGADRSH
jgi:hypothetical protein